MKMQLCRRDGGDGSRGVALISFVVALVVIGTLVLWVFQSTATGARGTLAHYYSTAAFYAAESGAEVAILESTQGAVGTIRGSAALATGTFAWQVVGTGPPTVYRSVGKPAPSTPPWDAYERTVEVITGG